MPLLKLGIKLSRESIDILVINFSTSPYVGIVRRRVKMSNGSFTASGYFVPFHTQGQEGCRIPTRSVGTVNARWLFPQEQAPSPPCIKGYLSIGSKYSAPPTSDGLQPAPSPRMMTRLDKIEAKKKATLAKMEAILEALRARPGIVPSVQIPSSTTMWMSLPTATGLSDNIATATLRIEEVCTRQDAHLEAFMADFRLIADNLNHCQPSTPASIVLIDDNETMTTMTRMRASTLSCQWMTPTLNSRTSPLSLPPLCHFSIRVQLYLSWGGGVHGRLPSCCRLLSQLPTRHKIRHADLNGLCCPCPQN